MKHCCKFNAFDIWYLKDTEDYTNRILFIGTCPICLKRVVELIQLRKKTNTYSTIKKIGDSTYNFLLNLVGEKSYSRNDLNEMMVKSKPFGWRYGVNRQVKDKSGNKSIEQYAVDFYGNSELVKIKPEK